jgi:ABC-type dipeptide/oligopeptide/nickel transport system ATPase subunit
MLGTFKVVPFINELSGGQMQRVVIARAICLEPDILICDEATSCLDVSTQKQIIDLLVSVKKQYNFSIILITHDLSIAQKICNQIYVMNSGEIVETIKVPFNTRDVQDSD